MALSSPVNPALKRSSLSTWGGNVIASLATTARTSGMYLSTSSASVTLPGRSRRLFGQSVFVLVIPALRLVELLSTQTLDLVIIGCDSNRRCWETNRDCLDVMRSRLFVRAAVVEQVVCHRQEWLPQKRLVSLQRLRQLRGMKNFRRIIVLKRGER